jgi:hypothetical protein
VLFEYTIRMICDSISSYVVADSIAAIRVVAIELHEQVQRAQIIHLCATAIALVLPSVPIVAIAIAANLPTKLLKRSVLSVLPKYSAIVKTPTPAAFATNLKAFVYHGVNVDDVPLPSNLPPSDAEFQKYFVLSMESKFVSVDNMITSTAPAALPALPPLAGTTASATESASEVAPKPAPTTTATAAPATPAAARAPCSSADPPLQFRALSMLQTQTSRGTPAATNTTASPSRPTPTSALPKQVGANNNRTQQRATAATTSSGVTSAVTPTTTTSTSATTTATTTTSSSSPKQTTTTTARPQPVKRGILSLLDKLPDVTK